MLGTNERKACVKGAAPSTWKHWAFQAEKSDLCPLVPLILVSLFIRGDLSSHPQDQNETQMREVAESTTHVPCQAQIKCLASANSLLLLFSVPSRVAAVCMVMTGYEKCLQRLSLWEIHVTSTCRNNFNLWKRNHRQGKTVPSLSAAWTIKY